MKNYHTRIHIDPEIMTGKPVIKGTRIPVELILKKLAQGTETKDILIDYPRLTKADIQAVIYYALESVENEEIYPIAQT